MAAVFWGVSPHSLVQKNQNTRPDTPRYSSLSNHKKKKNWKWYAAISCKYLRPPPHININFRVSKIAAKINTLNGVNTSPSKGTSSAFTRSCNIQVFRYTYNALYTGTVLNSSWITYTPIMQAASSSEKSVTINQSARRHTPDDSGTSLTSNTTRTRMLNQLRRVPPILLHCIPISVRLCPSVRIRN